MKHIHKKNEILIIKNISREGPGLIEDIIKEYGINYTIIDLSKSQKINTITNCGAVIVLGGPNSANDQDQGMKSVLTLIKKVLEANIPYLGICLGLQTFVKAAGGQVVKSPIKEVGFRDPHGDFFEIELTEEGKKDPLFKGLDNSLKVFHLHGETVNLTENMILMAFGKYCQNQIVKTGTHSYGVQCHFELTREMYKIWINEDPDLLKLETEELRSDFELIYEEYKQTGTQLFSNFLKIAGYT